MTDATSSTSAAVPDDTASFAASRPAWALPLWVLACLIVAVIVAFRETAITMVTIWYRSETFTHAFVVPPIVLWLAWRRRHEISRIAPKPALGTLIPISICGLAWLLGDLAGVNSVTQFALVALLALAVPAVLGLRVAYALLFPLSFMFFAVPTGEFLMPLFMEWTANFTVAALRLSGIPVVREGLQFVIPSGSWSVVEACSGIRYLIASVTVGALFAHLNYQSTRRRIAFVVVSFLVPVVANWVRAYIIVMLGHLSGNTLAVGADHLIYGWVFFGAVIMVMFVVGSRWAEPERAQLALPVQGVGTALAFAGTPRRAAFPVAALLAFMLMVLPLVARWWIDSTTAPGMVTMVAPTRLSPTWQKSAESKQEFKPSFIGPSVEANAWYGDGQQDVGLFLAFYRHQDYRRKLVSSQNVVVGSNDVVWVKVAGGSRTAFFGASPAIVRTFELRRESSVGTDGAARLVVWQIYWINGTLTSNDYAAKVYSAWFRLLGKGDDSAAIVVFAEQTRAGAADRTLESFLATNYEAIDALLKQAKASR